MDHYATKPNKHTALTLGFTIYHSAEWYRAYYSLTSPFECVERMLNGLFGGKLIGADPSGVSDIIMTN